MYRKEAVKKQMCVLKKIMWYIEKIDAIYQEL